MAKKRGHKISRFSLERKRAGLAEPRLAKVRGTAHLTSNKRRQGGRILPAAAV